MNFGEGFAIVFGGIAIIQSLRRVVPPAEGYWEALLFSSIILYYVSVNVQKSRELLNHVESDTSEN